MIVKPFGTENSDKHKLLFDPTEPVQICFWGMDKFGWALGFHQCVEHIVRQRAKFFGGVFFRRIRVLEWDGGNIKFADLTRTKFIKCFIKVYGICPKIEVGHGSTNLAEIACKNVLDKP